jgi:2-oxoglutarate dehydrogenase E2 component (dihydrolipoamide succinyltransferase)
MAVQILVPEMGESVLEATVASWHKQEGDFVNVGDLLVELETNKVNLEVSAKNAGVLARIQAAEGQDVKIGDVLGTIDEQAEKPKSAAPKPKADTVQTAPAKETAYEEKQTAERSNGRGGETREAPRVTPIASRLARDQGVDLSQVAGSGPEGRVTKADVEQFIQNETGKPEASAVPAARPAPTPPSAPATETFAPRREEHQRMSRRRRTIAQRLLEASQTTAMLTTFNEVDMGAVMDLRRRRGEDFQSRYGVKLGITSFFVKAAIGALKAFPRVNAEIQGDEMVLKYYYDIGIAIGDEQGLVVPVIRDADRLSFAGIERQIREYIARTNEGTLSIDDLRGGTFSITNGGVFGSLLSTPILNPPQVGILGLHKIEERPVAVEGQVVIRPMMYLALSYDHRIVDGREAVQFLVQVKQLVEDPERLLLEG